MTVYWLLPKTSTPFHHFACTFGILLTCSLSDWHERLAYPWEGGGAVSLPGLNAIPELMPAGFAVNRGLLISWRQ